MATSLVAAIKDALDLEAELVDGHNGIYEISVDGEVLYTNKGICSEGFPSDGDLVEQIGHFIGIEPKKLTASRLNRERGPSRPLSVQSQGDSTAASGPVTLHVVDTNSGCGCGPGESISASPDECCVPSGGDEKKNQGGPSGCC